MFRVRVSVRLGERNRDGIQVPDNFELANEAQGKDFYEPAVYCGVPRT